MKRLYSVLVCAAVAMAFGILATAPVSAQDKKTTVKTTTKQVKKSEKGPKYVCTKCMVGSKKAGSCPMCKGKMEKAKDYCCCDCKTMSDKGGKCKCGKEMHKGAEHMKYCAKCKAWGAKDKGCAGCEKHDHSKDKTKH